MGRGFILLVLAAVASSEAENQARRIRASLGSLAQMEKYVDSETAERYKSRRAHLGSLSSPVPIIVEKEPGVRVGGKFDAFTLTLLRITPGGPLDRAGGMAYMGWRLTQIQGQDVSTLEDIRRLGRPPAKVELRFYPPPTPPPASPAARRANEITGKAVKAARHTVVYVATGGLGGRVGGLLEAASMALLLGALLHVVWPEDSQCPGSVEDLFSFRSAAGLTAVEPAETALTPDDLATGSAAAIFDLALTAPPLWPLSAVRRLQRDKESGIRPPSDKDALAALRQDPPQPSSEGARRLPLRCRSSRGLPPLRMPRGARTADAVAEGAKHPVVQWAQEQERPCSILWHSHRANADAGLLRLAAETYGIGASEQVMHAVSMEMNRLKISTDVLGVHLRGALSDDVPRIVTGLKEQFGNQRVFVTADTDEVEAGVVEGLPGRASRVVKVQRGTREAMTDLMLLAAAHVPKSIPGVKTASAFRSAALALRDANILPPPPETP
eukprot:Hpha_TRINITY_DN1187_c0_g1::TRINITY_DN1187_c0_g1_i1::g.113087::m.113087